MNSSVHSEIFSKKLNQRFDIVVSELKNMFITTTIPKKRDVELSFTKEEELEISYFFGQFKYTFDVRFDDVVSKEKGMEYTFKIVSAEIEDNHRKEIRKNVEYKAIFWTKEGINYAEILDISESGMKLRTKVPFENSKSEVYYNERENKETKKIKVNVVWKKQEGNKYEYGLKIVK